MVEEDSSVLEIQEVEQGVSFVEDFDDSVEVLEVIEDVVELIIDEPVFAPVAAPIVAPTPVPVSIPVVVPDPIPVYSEPEPEPVYVPSVPVQTCCKVCRKGKACGDSCISRSYTCHKGSGCACNG